MERPLLKIRHFKNNPKKRKLRTKRQDAVWCFVKMHYYQILVQYKTSPQRTLYTTETCQQRTFTLSFLLVLYEIEPVQNGN
jgi:hypothetical protein